MIIAELKRTELHDHGLGGEKPSEDVSLALREKRKGLELIWNKDDGRWEIYLKTGIENGIDVLSWQMSSPVFGTTITPGITRWLEQFDSTKGDKFDAEDREKNHLILLKDLMQTQRKRKEKETADRYYELGHICKYLQNVMQGHRPITVPEAVGVTNKGKTVRMFQRPRYLKSKGR